MEKEKLPNSAQKLIDRIVSEARDEAEAMLDAAAVEAEDTLLVARDDIFKIEEEAELKAKSSGRPSLKRAAPTLLSIQESMPLKQKGSLLTRPLRWQPISLTPWSRPSGLSL